MRSNRKQKAKADCDFCKHEHNFEMPGEILEAIENEELIIFAGAGISTESNTVPHTLVNEIKKEINIQNEDINFSKIMSRFCKQKNGRRKLLNKIKNRMDFFKSNPRLYRVATRFHKELSTVPYIKNIITTNWDDLFEIECGATPIVSAGDFVFWDTNERKVFKLHGSINNYGSLIATEEDYKTCYKQLRDGLIGGYLRTILATKTVLFVGYSFSDEDFNKIYNILNSEMKNLIPHSYLVTTEDNKKFKKLNISTINTDATYFIEVLKKHLIAKKKMLADERFRDIGIIKMHIKKEHKKLIKIKDYKKNPEIIFSMFYQDGVTHSFDRIQARMNTGEFSDPHSLFHDIDQLKRIRKDMLKKGLYGDVAYLDGYIIAFIYLLAKESERKNISIYYLFGVSKPIRNLKQYLKLRKKAHLRHKSSYGYAKKIIKTKNIENSKNLIISQLPFLSKT